MLKPVTPLHVYTMSQLEDAFRCMQSGNNTGKIVIEVQPDDNVLVSTSLTKYHTAGICLTLILDLAPHCSHMEF